MALTFEQFISDLASKQSMVAMRLTQEPDQHPVIHIFDKPNHPEMDWVVVGDYVLLRYTFASVGRA